MANIFDETNNARNNVNINAFDWSHANNLTTDIGKITPVFCRYLPAHSSFRVNPVFGLQFMPMVFPVQTRLKARLMFFRYPLRALWDGWRDFVGNFREDIDPPYIDFSGHVGTMLQTGQLADYLDVPSVNWATTSSGQIAYTNTKVLSSWVSYDGNAMMNDAALNGSTGNETTYYVYSNFKMPFFTDVDSFDDNTAFTISSVNYAQVLDSGSWVYCTEPFVADTSHNVTIDSFLQSFDYSPIANNTTLIEAIRSNAIVGYATQESDSSTDYDLTLSSEWWDLSARCALEASLVQTSDISTSKTLTAGSIYRIVMIIPKAPVYEAMGSSQIYFRTFKGSTIGDSSMYYYTPGIASTTVTQSGYIDSSSSGLTTGATISIATSPFYDSSQEDSINDERIKLSAFPFRAYEGIYNAYFRDNRNNPYYVDGQVEYNKWLPTYDGGADNNEYLLHYANWEKDFLTTAVQQPQQGDAPRVGVTTQVSYDPETSASNSNTRLSTYLTTEDGKTYQVSFNSTGLAGGSGTYYTFSPVSSEILNDIQPGLLQQNLDLATAGIGINDLRNVNAFQKFLELNMRQGYSYKDIIEGRFNVNVRYDDLLMPEFIGGFSRDVNMNSVVQQVDQSANGSNYANALGSMAGLAGVKGSTDHNITCFCDEDSIIMGLLVVTPLPVYTQLLPKYMTYRSLLDYYQPEFDRIGYQPIRYSEVCPLQSYGNDDAPLNGVFGYNRPWYDLVSQVDSAHGLFRTSLRNFLMNRTFNSVPQLNQSFLLVDSDQVNDVFSVTEADDGTELTDKIYGQVYFDMTVKLPISRVAIPRLD